MNTEKIKTIIEDLSFNNENFEEQINKLDIQEIAYNPYKLELAIKNEDIIETRADLNALQAELDAHYAQETKVTQEEIKQVYLKLKNRDENPRGSFDKAGRSYVTDSDLLDVREPSAKYPYSQMNAARTAKFVKALAEKYRCQNMNELEQVACS